jgi:hypothetical protein
MQLGSQLATTTTCYACPGIVGKIVKIVVGIPATATTATLVVSKGSTALHATIAIETDLTAGTAAEVTLTATAQELTLAVADILKAVWTVTDAGGTFVGGDATVWIEPDTW